jgi:hypothetical protein
MEAATAKDHSKVHCFGELGIDNCSCQPKSVRRFGQLLLRTHPSAYRILTAISLRIGAKPLNTWYFGSLTLRFCAAAFRARR